MESVPDHKAILGVVRAPFLLLPVALVAAGAAASAHEGGFSWLRSALALVGLTAAHAAVNALNEASDMRTGIDLRTTRTPFSGGSGTLPTGAMTARGARVWGLTLMAVAAAIGVVLTLLAGWLLLPPIAVGAFAVLLYTPWLTRSGLGEIFAGLGLGALPVLGVSIAQDGTAGPVTVAAAVPAFLMTLNLLLLNEFPDEEADRAGGRRNLVLLLGRRRAALVYATATLAVPAWLATAVATRVLPPLALVATLPTLAAVPGLRWALGAPETATPIPALGGNVVWNLATNALLAGSLVLAGAIR